MFGVALAVLLCCRFIPSCPLHAPFSCSLKRQKDEEYTQRAIDSSSLRVSADSVAEKDSSNPDEEVALNPGELRLMEHLEAAKKDVGDNQKLMGFQIMKFVVSRWVSAAQHRALSTWLKNVLGNTESESVPTAVTAHIKAHMRLAELKAQRKAGIISEEEYRRQKASLKSSLKSIAPGGN